jgi:hypothetical protein
MATFSGILSSVWHGVSLNVDLNSMVTLYIGKLIAFCSRNRRKTLQSNLVSSPLVSSPTSPLAKLSLAMDFPQVLGASFRYLAISPLANISGWTNGGELRRFDWNCFVCGTFHAFVLAP